jgi:hypothetical protein
MNELKEFAECLVGNTPKILNILKAYGENLDEEDILYLNKLAENVKEMMESKPESTEFSKEAAHLAIIVAGYIAKIHHMLTK